MHSVAATHFGGNISSLKRYEYLLCAAPDSYCRSPGECLALCNPLQGAGSFIQERQAKEPQEEGKVG